MNATELSTAIKRAGSTQDELARKLGRSRSMISGWMKADRVPRDWEPLVREALGMPDEAPSPLDAFDDADLLIELLARARRRREG